MTINLKETLEPNNFIVANLDMGSFYRVNYDEANWKLIAKQLYDNKEVLHTIF